MLSLPMIPPRADPSLWPSHRIPNTHSTDSSSTSPPNAPQRRPQSHHSPHPAQTRPTTSALLASLAQDENNIEQRKLNVRRFGAGWLRPPGVQKTLQATQDEQLEKEEQEMMQQREQVMLDLAAAQQDAANAEARAQTGDVQDDDDESQRDLDDDVPDAESEVSSADDLGSETEEDNENEATVPFNEDSFIEGSMLEAEVSHMLEMEEAEMAGVLQDERDLDDDVPEAGEYEHTDSELEDESDDDDTGNVSDLLGSVRSRRSRRESGLSRRSARRSSGLPSGFAGARGHGGSHPGPLNLGPVRGIDLGVDLGNGRSSFGMDGSSSIMEGSSFLRSSPAATASRGSLRDRFLGAMRGGRRG